MNIIKNILLITLVALFTTNCKNEAKPEVKTVEVETEASKTIDPNATYAKAEFTIDGMTCAIGCAKTIESKISKMDGVKSATVDFDKKLAMVEYNEAKVTPVLLEETVNKVSDIYKVSNMKTTSGVASKKGCNKACCDGKTDEEKASCKMACCAETSSAKTKKACEPGCKKTCCAEKAKA